MNDRPILFSAPMVCALVEGRKTQTRRALKLQPIPFAIDEAGTLCDVSLWHVDREPWPRIWMGRDKSGVLTTQEVRFAAGQRLWVKETWQTGAGGDGPQIAYRATGDCHDINAWDGEDEGAGPSFNYARCPGTKWHTWLPDLLSGVEGHWRPSIYMPRWASRLTLIVTEVRVERLQAISEADAVAEGCVASPFPGPWWQGYRREDDGELVHQQVVGDVPPDWMIEPHRMSSTAHLDRSARDDFGSLWRSINGPESWAANPFVAAVNFEVLRSNIDDLPSPVDAGAVA